MATFLIVHGAFGGGWEWTGVARALRARGHEAFTPTLTGLGERHHLGPAVGLGTNVEDVLGLLAFEDLRDVVLCGASYGGMTAAADRRPIGSRSSSTSMRSCHATGSAASIRSRPRSETFLEPVRLSGAVERIPRAFIRCTTPSLDVGEDLIAPVAERARAAGWPYRELAAPHDPHLYDPDAVATLLHEIATSQGAMPG